MEICQTENNLTFAGNKDDAFGNCDIKNEDVNGNHGEVRAPKNSCNNLDKESDSKKDSLNVGYIFSKKLDQEINKNEKIENRSLMLSSLLHHSGLLKVSPNIYLIIILSLIHVYIL